jgi:hypothetical protein
MEGFVSTQIVATPPIHAPIHAVIVDNRTRQKTQADNAAWEVAATIDVFGCWRTVANMSGTDGEGFEPPVSLDPRRFSRPVP